MTEDELHREALAAVLQRASITERWCEAIRAAWSECYGQRLAVLRGRYPKQRDGRGLDVFSLECGRIFALQDLEPALACAEFDPVVFRHAAEKDAYKTRVGELLEEAHGSAAAESGS